MSGLLAVILTALTVAVVALGAVVCRLRARDARRDAHMARLEARMVAAELVLAPDPPSRARVRHLRVVRDRKGVTRPAPVWMRDHHAEVAAAGVAALALLGLAVGDGGAVPETVSPVQDRRTPVRVAPRDWPDPSPPRLGRDEPEPDVESESGVPSVPPSQPVLQPPSTVDETVPDEERPPEGGRRAGGAPPAGSPPSIEQPADPDPDPEPSEPEPPDDDGESKPRDCAGINGAVVDVGLCPPPLS